MPSTWGGGCGQRGQSATWFWEANSKGDVELLSKVSKSGCVDGRNLRCCNRDGFFSLFYCRYWIRIRPERRSFYMTLNGVYYFCCVDGVLHLRLTYLHLGWASHLRWAHARCCFKSITAERDLNHIIPFGCQKSEMFSSATGPTHSILPNMVVIKSLSKKKYSKTWRAGCLYPSLLRWEIPLKHPPVGREEVDYQITIPSIHNLILQHTTANPSW